MTVHDRISQLALQCAIEDQAAADVDGIRIELIVKGGNYS